MSTLLTRDEFQAIADSLTPATNAFVNGKFLGAASGETLITENGGISPMRTGLRNLRRDLPHAVS